MTDKPDDPRDPLVFDKYARTVKVDLDANPWLTLTPAPLDGATEASVLHAQRQQQAERKAAMDADEDRAATDLRQSSLMDSLYAEKVAKALYGSDLSDADRKLAGAMAVREFDPLWETVGRYRAAQGVLLVLRNVLSEHGLSSMIPDQAMRDAADRMAGIAHSERVKVLTNTRPVHFSEWQRARLGFLHLGEDR